MREVMSCCDCGTKLQARRSPDTRWGFWCGTCCGWWPDTLEGKRGAIYEPPKLRLVDDPRYGLVVEPA